MTTDSQATPIRRPPIPLFTRLAGYFARFCLRVLASVRIEGLENVPPKGALIVIANHISNTDPPFVAGWLTPRLGTRINILAKESLFVGPIAPIIRALGASPVRAGGSDIEAYRYAQGILDSGAVLCIFPEGTRSTTGVMGEPKPGVAMLALRSGVPVLPVGVSNTDTFLGRGRRFPRLRTPIYLRVGRPFTLTAGEGLTRREATHAASDELMGRIAELVDERHRGRYGAASAADAAPLRSAGNRPEPKED